METFSNFKPMITDPRYQDRRKHCLDQLNQQVLDAPLSGLVGDLCKFPFCFTIQSCFGHFVLSGQEDPGSFEFLQPIDNLKPVKYRIAYIALCIENSRSGNVLLRLLKQVPEIDPAYIQFGCAEWFWERYPNSYVLQVEPERHMLKDTCMVDHQEAIQVEKVRNAFYERLKVLITTISRP